MPIIVSFIAFVGIIASLAFSSFSGSITENQNVFLAQMSNIFQIQREEKTTDKQAEDTIGDTQIEEKNENNNTWYQSANTTKNTIPKTEIEKVEEKPEVLVDTYIISTFRTGEVFDETNQVTIRFNSKITPEETEGRVYYQTMVLDFDQDWKKTYSKKITLTLPYKEAAYTFLVKAGINNFIDSTPAEKTFKINISPYFGKIEIYSIKEATTRTSSLITLKNKLGRDEEINITGWEFKESVWNFTIPKGVEKYPNKNPVISEDIVIKYGDKIYLSGALNPFGGKDRNFRVNKCMGYMTHSTDFPINISKKCPKPDKDEFYYLEPCCQKYINQMKTCELPKYDELATFGITTDSQCSDYLYANFGYTDCFNKYSRDENFLENEWHIYMKKEFKAGGCDTVYLQDQNGLLIDKYIISTTYCGKVRL